MTDSLFAAAYQCLAEADLGRKAARADALQADWRAGRLVVARGVDLPDVTEAGRPARPVLVIDHVSGQRRNGIWI